MNCRQCGKKTEQLCERSDCWATKTNLALERRRVRREVAKELRNDENLAVAAFSQNFHAVSAWAQALGALRPQDKDAIRKMASVTVYAAMTYAAIARSL
jgi:hypothetical protein